MLIEDYEKQLNACKLDNLWKRYQNLLKYKPK